MMTSGTVRASASVAISGTKKAGRRALVAFTKRVDVAVEGRRRGRNIMKWATLVFLFPVCVMAQVPEGNPTLVPAESGDWLYGGSDGGNPFCLRAGSPEELSRMAVDLYNSLGRVPPKSHWFCQGNIGTIG